MRVRKMPHPSVLPWTNVVEKKSIAFKTTENAAFSHSHHPSSIDSQTSPHYYCTSTSGNSTATGVVERLWALKIDAGYMSGRAKTQEVCIMYNIRYEKSSCYSSKLFLGKHPTFFTPRTRGDILVLAREHPKSKENQNPQKQKKHIAGQLAKSLSKEEL